MAPRARTLGTVAIACAALAAATTAQAPGCHQTAHIALVKDLGEGAIRIGRYATETCDESYGAIAAITLGLAWLLLPLSRLPSPAPAPR